MRHGGLLIVRGRVRLLLALLAAAIGTPLAAQEFVQQTLLVAPLYRESDVRTARQVAAALRSRIARLSSRRELRVVDGDTTERVLEYAGYQRDTVVGGIELRDLVRLLRADEVVVGTVSRTRGGPVEVRAELRLARDWRMRQPLRTVRAATAAAAGDSLAHEVVHARTQMAGLRRCENAARAADAARAVAAALPAVAGYPRSTLARTCLALELVMSGAPADSIVEVTDAVLAVDSSNIVAAVLRAQALSAAKHAGVAAAAWGRVVALRPDSVELGVRAVEWMLQLHEPSVAVTAARRLLAVHRGEPRLRRYLFRAYSALPDLGAAAALGDSLDADDPEFRGDSVFAASHVAALRAVGDTLGAMSKAARAVKQHPNDPILYLEYLQLVSGEDGAALRRGLERFPDVAELHVLASSAARATGNAADEMASLRTAVRLDPQMTRGYLRMAELWFAQHRMDSALIALARAPRSGQDADLVRSYAVGRGLQVLRASPTPTPETQRTTLALFAMADSVDSRDDTRRLIAAVALQLAQGALATAAQARQCPAARDAASALATADSALARGVGEGASADELRDAYVKLRDTAQGLSKSLCPG